ncbi:MAG: hypothetical protein RIS88_1581 [Pseudomonadota bacterium]
MTRPPRPETCMPVLQEHLEVRREVVDTGRPLRLRKEVQEVPVLVKESLATDTVEVQRVPIGRVVDEMPVMRHEGEVTVVPVIEERLVTRKELVLVEEIRLTRQRKVTPFEAEVSLRREQVRVERFDPGSGQWRDEPARQEPPSDPSTQESTTCKP